MLLLCAVYGNNKHKANGALLRFPFFCVRPSQESLRKSDMRAVMTD